jgi:hypothetical protein
MRAAFFIAQRYGDKPPGLRDFVAQARAQTEEMLESAGRMVNPKGKDTGLLSRARLEIRERMSACGAAIRDPARVGPAVGAAWSLYARLKSELNVPSAKDLHAAFRVLDLCLTHALYLEAIHEYLERGGRSRGSYLVLDKAGAKPCAELDDGWRFALNPKPSWVDQKILEISLDQSERVVKEWVDVRRIPREEGWFENVWQDFREGRIIREED